MKNLKLGALHMEQNMWKNFSVRSSPIFKRPSLSLRVPRSIFFLRKNRIKMKMSISVGGILLTGEKLNYWEINLFTINLTWTDQESKPGLRGQRQVTTL